MPHPQPGYSSRVLWADLTTAKTWVEEPDPGLLRQLMGGSALGASYLLRHTSPGADPLGPENVLVFAASVVGGAPVSGASRFTVTAKSPLTGTIGDSQAGGWWAPELRAAGFDAVVVKGASPRPVYLWVTDGRAEIRPAQHLWGLDTGQAETLIRAELGDPKVRIALIGPAGENLVRFACILTDLKHAAGRTGMGAVMGAKGLKAIAVRGDRSRLVWHDLDAIRRLHRAGRDAMANHPNVQGLRDLGSNGVLGFQLAVGGLPSRNWTSGVLAGAEALTGEAMRRDIYVRSEACAGCVVACKQVVQVRDPSGSGFLVDPNYGGPEYESVACLGAYTGVTDLVAVARATELCNRYGLDTISTGAMVAFAMEAGEKGLIAEAEATGVRGKRLNLRFGDSETLLALVEAIARREGLGAVLAEGPVRAAKAIGRGADALAMHVKGSPLPAHMPQHKASLALAYALTAFGPDHCSSEHDLILDRSASDESRNHLAKLGLAGPGDPAVLDEDRVRFFVTTQRFYGLIDSLNLCLYVFGTDWLYDLEETTTLVHAATGWDVTPDELMKVGERRNNLLRAFGAREGFGRAADVLPGRLGEPLPDGLSQGMRVDLAALERAKDLYYILAGWDPVTGYPTRRRLAELGIEWAGHGFAAPAN